MSLYDDLEVPPTASAEEIKAAYRRLAQDYHPDRNQGATVAVRRMAEERLKRMNVAYETLKDPARRLRYDASQGVPRSDTAWQSSPGQGPRPRHEPANGNSSGGTSSGAGARSQDEAHARDNERARARQEKHQQDQAEIDRLRRRLREIEEKRAGLAATFQARLDEAQRRFAEADARWQQQQRESAAERRRARGRAVGLWLAAALGLALAMTGVVVFLHPEALALWNVGDSLEQRTLLAQLSFLGVVLGYEWLASVAILWPVGRGLGALLKNVALGLAAVLATLVATACMVSMTWVSLEFAAYALVCWPAAIHGVMGMIVIGAAGRRRGEARRPTDTGADIRAERDQTLRRYDGDVALEYQRITARLHALGF